MHKRIKTVDNIWKSVLYAAVGLPIVWVLLFFLIRWLDRPANAQPTSDRSAWILRHNRRLRVAMTIMAATLTFIFGAFLFQVTFLEGEANQWAAPEAVFVCLGSWLLLSLYCAASTHRHKVILSDKGLTIHALFRQPVQFAWQDIEEVTYSSYLQVYRVRRKGGGVEWISEYLNGMELLYQYLDHYLGPDNPDALPVASRR